MRSVHARIRCGLAVALLLGCPAWAPAQEAAPAGEPARFRVVFSSRYFTDVHETDAKAGLKAWAETIARERHIEAEPDPQVVEGLPALRRAWEVEQADLVSMTVDEYLDLGMNQGQAALITGAIGGQYLEEYLLLVHRDSDIQSLAGLKGRTVVMWENTRTSLAGPWLDTILLEQGHPPAGGFLSRVSQVRKLSGVVLPVFFRQADACVVTRGGLATLTELNPQVGGRMRVLATSPPLLPSLALTRTGTTSSLKGIDLLQEVRLLHTTPAGKQLLNMFQMDRVVELKPADLDTARRLLAEHRRLMAKWNPGVRPGSPARPATAAAAGFLPATPGGRRP